MRAFFLALLRKVVVLVLTVLTIVDLVGIMWLIFFHTRIATGDETATVMTVVFALALGGTGLGILAMFIPDRLLAFVGLTPVAARTMVALLTFGAFLEIVGLVMVHSSINWIAVVSYLWVAVICILVAHIASTIVSITR